jgi:hypothetical protein
MDATRGERKKFSFIGVVFVLKKMECTSTKEDWKVKGGKNYLDVRTFAKRKNSWRILTAWQCDCWDKAALRNCKCAVT